MTKFAPDGSALVFSTFLGSPGLEASHCRRRHLRRKLPHHAGSLPNRFRGRSRRFRHQGEFLDVSWRADLDAAQDIALNDQNEPHIVGVTDSSNLPVTDDAYQSRPGGGLDAFGAVFEEGLELLLFEEIPVVKRTYATYLGGSGNDDARGVAVDPFDNLWIVGSTTSQEDFPTTPNAPNPDFLGGDNDGFLARLPLPDGDLVLDPAALLNELFDEPNVTFTGDANLNFGFGVDIISHDGRVVVVSSESPPHGRARPHRPLRGRHFFGICGKPCV